MLRKLKKHVQWLVAGSVLVLVCLLEIIGTYYPDANLLERFESITYDWRVQYSARRATQIASNLGAIFIDDDTLALLNKEYQYNYPLPRQVYGKVVRELNAQGVKGVGFDILFAELHAPSPNTDVTENKRKFSSDEFFAEQAKSAPVVLAVMGKNESDHWFAIPPAEMFRTNVSQIGHIVSEPDKDNVVRRILPFRMDPQLGRIWHMGIVLAAKELQLDLDHPVITAKSITLNGPNGIQRVIPVDRSGALLINWVMEWNDRRLLKDSLENLMEYDKRRNSLTNTEPLIEEWKDKLVIIGSIGSGNNISDIGATALTRQTYLVSKHWNVANSVLMNQFVSISPLWLNLCILILMGFIAAILSLKLRALAGFISIMLLLVSYCFISWQVFLSFRLWLPVILPLFGSLLTTHVCMVTYRVIFEQNERRRVKAVFSKIVSPNVVSELLGSEKLSLGGARREITVYFADVRGFTEMTDMIQARAEEYVKLKAMNPVDAEQFFELTARETLETVNLYLATIADTIKKHDGTLDKYIGDCVMAFWGAPIANAKHALSCVRSAIDAQRDIYRLNLKRAEENKDRERDNPGRAANGERELPMLPLLSLGSGINTGSATVGLMGSDAHIFNYTVFGREINLASRLEGVSGRGRIIISESTFQHLLRDDPTLAATCVQLPPEKVKGFRNAIPIYEVPWKLGMPDYVEPPAAAVVSSPAPAAH